MRLRQIALLPVLLMLAICVHAQGKIGGTGLTGGTGGWQAGSPHLTITTSGLSDGIANVAYSQTLTAVNGVTPFTWSLLLGTLPAGLTLHSATGVIDGTPTTPGVSVFTILVTDSTSPTAQTATQQLSISVDCPPLNITSASPLPSGTKGVGYGFTFQSSGGLGAITWTAGTGLPTGVTLSSVGVLAGTPTVSGSFTFNVTATDSCPSPQAITQPFTVQINTSLTIITTSPLPAGTVGSTYQTQMAAQGGTSPFTWSITAGTLPTGLGINSVGIISGTPTVAVTSTVTIQVNDSGGLTNSAPFTITTSCTPLSITSSTTLPVGAQGDAYRYQMQSSGGQGAVAWSATSLPSGLNIASGGLISGTPTVSGTFSPVIQAQDSCAPTPQVASNTFTIQLGASLTITTTTLPSATEGQAYNASISASGGIPPYTWSLPGGPIQAGAVDLLDWAMMPLPTRNTSHLTGAGLYKAFHQDGGMFWWLKNSPGNPWDGELYDGTNIYHWFTEDGDPVDQPACVAAGFANCFLDPSASKTFITPVPIAPRYFVLGGPDVTISSPGPNLVRRTTNCGLDNQTPFDLGNIVGVTHDAGNISYGGTIGTGHTVIINYYWGLASVTPPFQSGTRERLYLDLPFGQVQWDTANWNGSTYAVTQTSLTNNVVAGGAPTPNFACKVPTLPIVGGLPPGVTVTSAPRLNLADTSGVVTGTPTLTGTTQMIAQVEDSQGTIAQGNVSLTVTCPALTITSTSPLPNGTQAQAYNFTFTSSGGILPIAWSRIAGTLPTGMSLSAAGILSGTPTNFGTFNFTVQALDSCLPLPHQSVQQPVTLTIVANSGALTVTTASPLPSGVEGIAYSDQLTATGGTPPYVWSVSAGTPPAGLSLSAGGLLSGTPTSAATTAFTAKVTDNIATQATKSLSTTIACPAFAISSTSPLTGATQNQPYSFQFTKTGGFGAVTWSATSVPAGLSMSTSGLLSGTPTGTGTSTINVSVTDSCSPTPQTLGPTGFSLTITQAIPALTITTTSPLPAATELVPYNTSLTATGGVPPYTWSITLGSLQSGLSLSTAGNISGTPTSASTVTPTFQVQDSVSTTVTKILSLTVSCPAFTVTSSATLPNATQNQPYAFQFTSSGGITPISWTGTSIPTGLTLSLGGLLSGTPTGNGAFTPAITATDSCVPTPQAVGPTTFNLTVNNAPVPLSITTATPLPSGTVNVPYSTQISATGGSPPYTFTVSAGSLPTGLSLASSTGILSGTPTVAQTTTPTIKVTDNVAATATKAFTITIAAAATADNRYCSSNETVVNLPQDGVAAPLQRCVNTALANTPASGPTKTVCASGCDFTTLQAAVTASSCGWIIQIKSTNNGLPGGTQNTYNGTTTLPAKSCTRSNWIIIETDQVSGLPSEGSRITPAWIGRPSLPGRPAYAQPATPGFYLPKLMNNGTVLTCAAGANFYRLIGLELTTSASGTAEIFRCVGADHIIRDRMISHGGNNPNWQDKGNTTRNEDWATSTYQALIDSYYGDVHITGTGSSNILIGGCASTLEGPDKVVDNFMEAADSSSGLGGCGAGTASINFQDLEWRRNHIFKPVFWKTNDPTYFGTLFAIKNHIDWKNGVRILVEANILDQSWGQQSDQPGPSVEFGAKNQSSFTQGTASSSGSTITALGASVFPSTMTATTCANPGHCNIIFNGVTYQTQTQISTKSITVSPTPPVIASASYKAFAPGLNPNATVSDITFRYNYIKHASRCIEIFSALSDGGDIGKFTGRVELHDNVCDDIDGSHWNLSGGACCAWSIGLYIANSFPSPNYLDQIDFHHNTVLPSLSGGAVGDGPSLGFGGQTSTTGAIGHLKIYDNIAAAGMGRSTAGVCTTAKTALNDLICWDAVNHVQLNSFCFDHNILATTTATSGSVTGTANIPPYPAAGQSPGCGFATVGNPLPASYNAIQFTTLNGANGGNYLLQGGSPYHNTASDGQDPGVAWATFQTFIAGVQ